MRRVWPVIAVVLLLVWGQSALYTVDQAEFGYVTRFGDPTVTQDGKDDAGLHVKLPWPVDSVTRVDRRLQVFDLPPTEALTRDRQGRTVDKTIAVDAFVCWRVPDATAADRFIRTVGTAEQARRLLTPRLTGRLAAVISNLPLDDVIQVADAEADAIRNEAHSKDREFYAFLQKLAAYRAMLAETRDVLLLSAKNELFDLLLKPPAAAPKKD
jgi:modulator of FtsH protease HflC